MASVSDAAPATAADAPDAPAQHASASAAHDAPSSAADEGPRESSTDDGTRPADGMPKPVALQSNEQWTMRVNRDGLPVCRDLHGLFTTVIISLCDRWPDWRYPLAFVLPAVVQRMQSLQFVQIVRDSANGMYNMLSLSQTMTSFTMDSATATRISQAFIDACLLERVLGQEDEVYAPSPKGLHLIDRFVTRHGIATRSVSNLLNIHTLCDKLLFMERDDQDDVLLSDAVVRIVFNRLVGRSPRRAESSSMGLAMETSLAYDSQGHTYETARFSSYDALWWLVNYTTLASVDEAIVLAAHMVRLGWLEPETHMPHAHSSRVAVVRVDDEMRAEGASTEGAFVEGETYHITELGATVAWKMDWIEQPAAHAAEPQDPAAYAPMDAGGTMRPSATMDSFEMYNSYMKANGSQTSLSQAAHTQGPQRSGTVRSRASTYRTADLASPPVSAPRAAPVARRPVQEVLRHARQRVALNDYLATSSAPQSLALWCQIEWFRDDCRRAATGELERVDALDAVVTLPSEVAAGARATGKNAASMRTRKRTLLAERAQYRLDAFLREPQTGCSSAALDKLRATLEHYVALASTPLAEAEPAPDLVKKSENALAKLLLASSAAQKEVIALLGDSLLPSLYDAVDAGTVPWPNVDSA